MTNIGETGAARNFGGNVVRVIESPAAGVRSLASGPYDYLVCGTTPWSAQGLRELKSYTVVVIDPAGEDVVLSPGQIRLGTCDVAQVEGLEATVTATGESPLVLVAGTTTGTGAAAITVTRANDLYRVVKPWGYELWLNGEHPAYAFKKIFVRAGNRTSLQYHYFKKETNFLLEGRSRLYYSEDGMAAMHSRPFEVTAVDLAAPCTIDVPPGTLHRLEALTDIVLYESSTPHLNDVIRVTDDAGRADGRVAAEHPRLS